jgi:ribosomal protein S18 acetylase RimI-like enzyme
MKPNLSARIATMSDINGLAILFNEYRIFYGQPDDIVLARQFLTGRFHLHQSVVFIAQTEGAHLVGFAQLYPTFSSVSAKPAWILNDLYVDKHARGSGIASALLQAVLQHGKDTGAAWVTLQTAVDNKAAQALYKKFGFIQEQKFLTFVNSLRNEE